MRRDRLASQAAEVGPDGGESAAGGHEQPPLPAAAVARVAEFGGIERAAVGQGGEYPVYWAGQKHRNCAPGQATFSIKTEVLDAAAWEKVEELLLKPDRFEAFLAGRDDRDPSAERLATVDRAIADAREQQANIAAAIGRLGDPDASAPLEARLQALADAKQKLTAERDGLLARQRDWQDATAQRHALIDWWCNAAAIGEFDYDGKREALALLGIKAKVWAHGRYRVVAPPDPGAVSRATDHRAL